MQACGPDCAVQCVGIRGSSNDGGIRTSSLGSLELERSSGLVMGIAWWMVEPEQSSGLIGARACSGDVKGPARKRSNWSSYMHRGQ